MTSSDFALLRTGSATLATKAVCSYRNIDHIECSTTHHEKWRRRHAAKLSAAAARRSVMIGGGGVSKTSAAAARRRRRTGLLRTSPQRKRWSQPSQRRSSQPRMYSMSLTSRGSHSTSSRRHERKSWSSPRNWTALLDRSSTVSYTHLTLPTK